MLSLTFRLDTVAEALALMRAAERALRKFGTRPKVATLRAGKGRVRAPRPR